ncbi:glutathione peroxidase [Sporolactobacillus shoreicorticis]|uniref:Glutathione peroxidase n=1 Tax=Sporolactobacillus shoreicorticis TaxID=1923877 RepID=A0ABW5RZP9_9BACL|nr:glutathione peroxidase [Sporolactobacillus shoreicorticis]MCO7126989.1 glutathione peroxidase [Sporolactobacillus shoreicorticis]
MTLYDYSFSKLTGSKTIPLSDYRNQVLLIVNTASKCGFTPQYEGLEKLYETYKDQGFTVLGFPSDSFFNQEFADNEKTAEFCKLNYGVTFPLFQKSKMKGKEMNPLFHDLLEESGEKKITWNFNKFLIGRDGSVMHYYGSRTKPEAIENEIQLLLKK